jgi:hypothetical protein
LPAEILSEAEGFKHASEGIYPDNVQAVKVFSDMLTQWRVGPGGLVGFDYCALPVVFRIRKISHLEREDVFDGLMIMERAAIDCIRQKSSN